MVKIIGGKEFVAIPSTNAENNSIFLDSSDNKLKKKDNSGSVSNLGGNEAAFWLNSDLYDVYDDFDSYSTGSFTTNAKWTVSATAQASATIVTSTNANGSNNELKLTTSIGGTTSGGTYTVTVISTNSLSDNKHTHIKTYTTQTKNSNIYSISTSFSMNNGGTWYTLHSGTATSSPGIDEIFIVAKGSNIYDLYINGKKYASDISVTDLRVGFKNSVHNSGNGDNLGYLYIDDIRQAKSETI